MKRVYKFKKLQLVMLLNFIVLCLISTIIFKNSVAPLVTDKILESRDTTFLYYIMSEAISDGINPAPLFSQFILIIKASMIVAFLMISIYSIIRLRGYKNIIDWIYMIISGFVVAIHFVSFESGSKVAILIRKLYVSYYLGVTDFPMIIYYAVILQLVVIMIGLLLFELKLIKSRNVMIDQSI